MSYFFGGASDDTPKPDLEQNRASDVIAIGQPISDELQQIDAYEKQSLVAQVDANHYVRRVGKWQFRRDWGVKEFAMRTGTLSMLFCVAFFSKPGTPRGREDREWLITFSLVMIIWFAFLHAIAYLPAAIFGGFSDMIANCRGQVSHSLENWREYQYAAAIFVLVIVLYPFIIFFTLIVDGFNPYDELTHAEAKLEGGLQADLNYIFRKVLHIFLIIVTIYMILIFIVLFTLRHVQRYPGQFTWIAVKISRWPYGALFFEEGEFYDCGICLEGIWSGSDVCRLNCNSTHVFHADCIRRQINDHGNKYCVLCHQPISVQNPPEPETTE